MQNTILPNDVDTSIDVIESSLQNISQNIIVFVFGLLPLFFLPVLAVPQSYVKTIFVIFGVLFAIVFFSLTVLRSGKLSISASLPLFVLWACALTAILSALLSGDMRDSFLGDDFSIHTALFIVLLAMVATIAPLFGQTKTTIMRLYILLTGSALLLGLFHLIRLLFGPETLTLGVFSNLVASPVGGWNDLALFFGLSILLSLVALEQLPLTTWGKGLFSAVVGLALCMLAVVNFFAVWVVLGLVSLIVLMYSLSKDRFTEKTLTLEGKRNTVSLQSVILSVCVLIVSIVFIIGGGAVGGYISNLTHISYVEVRPSFGATVDIARNVYHENALMGIGPNKFVDAWRLYKDPSINATLFWSTDFSAGNGYIPTLFVTTGVLGAVMWIVFFVLLLIAGFRMLLRSTHVDRFWYFIGTSSFVAAVYLWGMAFLYVPGMVILLLAALFSGILFVAYGALVPTRTLSISIASNKRAGFALVAVVMLVIISATSGLYYVGQQYASVSSYGTALRNLYNGIDTKKSEENIAKAYTTSQNETYAWQLASYQLAKINAFANVKELNATQQQELQNSIRNGITSAQIAVEKDPSDSVLWSTLGNIFSVLAGASVEGAQGKAKEAFTNAQKYDPQNPLYPLLQGQLLSRVGDLSGARAQAIESIKLKSNYMEALVFLAQIDIAEGKTDSAIETTQAIISLEPNNPARYYQLGILESVKGNAEASIAAFEDAVRLDTNYANARYQLALALAKKGETNNAIEQLKVVQNLNPGNADISTLISRLESGEAISSILVPSGTVAEPQTVTANEDAVTTTEDTNTSLIKPVNTVGNTSNSESPKQTPE